VQESTGKASKRTHDKSSISIEKASIKEVLVEKEVRKSKKFEARVQ